MTLLGSVFVLMIFYCLGPDDHEVLGWMRDISIIDKARGFSFYFLFFAG